MTFFRTNYRKHTPFSQDSRALEFDGGNTVAAGKISRATIPRAADLVTDIFVRIKGCTAEAYDNWAHNLIKRVTLKVGSSTVCKIEGDYMAAWEHLASSPSQQQQSLGKSGVNGDVLVCIPLFLSSAEGGSAQALPLVALQYHSVVVEVEWRNVTGTETANLQVNTVYLDVNERAKLARDSFDMIITEVQQNNGFNGVDGDAHIDLHLNHAVKEIILLTKATADSYPKAINDATGGSGERTKLAFTGHMDFRLNNAARFESSIDAEYLHHVARRCHSGSRQYPRRIATIPFALQPEDPAPTGSLNFSRIDTARLSFETIDKSDSVVYALSHNIFRVAKGLGGLAYAST